MASNLNCGNCGARVSPGLQWCTLCHADLRPPPTPEELAELPPPPLPRPPSPPSLSPSERPAIPPPPHAGGNVPPVPQLGGPAEPPIAPPPFDGADHAASGQAASQGVEQWGVLLAAAESQQKSRMGKALASRGTRITVALLGALGVMLVLTVIGTMLGAVFS
ncbi:MAG: hypothetical protein K0U62_05505 [Actinomycetia bacterium]|nr:hypothetical protein [Actinomycetes bacterium]